MRENDALPVLLKLHDGNGTLSESNAANPLPVYVEGGTLTGGGGSSGVTAYGAPEVTYFVNVLNTATAVVGADATRTLIQFWNQSSTEIDLFPAASGIVFGQAIPLPPKPSSGPNPPLQFYTTCAWQAIHNSTGNQGLFVVCWSS